MTDLTILVDQVAERHYLERCKQLTDPQPDWEHLDPMLKHRLHEWVLPTVNATVDLMVEAMKDAVAEERDRMRATNNRLHKRAQLAESAAMTTVEDCKRQGVSLGRMLANAAANKYAEERDEALAAVERVRALHSKTTWIGGGSCCAACLEPVESEPCTTIRALDGN